MPTALLALLLAVVLLLPAAARAQDQPAREFQECAECPVMVAIPAGSFVMGSPVHEPGRFDAEGPQHRVSLKAFALGKYDVTNTEFLAFLRETGYQPAPCDHILGLSWSSPGGGIAFSPGRTDAPREPAVCLNWGDAQAYVTWLNGKVRGLPSVARHSSGPYHLPSEAQWEYAARAGTVTARWWGQAIGRGNTDCDGCGSVWDGHRIAPVGSFRPNPFGLYEMLGNVWQWVDDCWHENYAGAPADGSSWRGGNCDERVLRGGSWSNTPAFIRAAMRAHADDFGRNFDYSGYAGFRVARDLP